MRNSTYVKNHIISIKNFAKERGYKVEYIPSDVDFYFIVYKRKFFGLYNEFVKKFYGCWDGRKYKFDNVWDDVRKFIMYKTENEYYKKYN
jgi:hypothetical protein